jgi:RNA-directed DNA polymerase
MNAKANYIEEKVQELREKLYLAAKKSATRRFHALFDKVYRMDFLMSAWKQVKANKGSPGIDNETISDITKKGEDIVLAEIQYRLRNKKYFPKKVRRVFIPKPDGRQRPLGIPTVRDRIVQTSTKLLIEPIFEADFLDCSYGFRPNRRAHDALEEIRKTMNAGYTVILDADIKKFFDNINHDKLLDFVYQRINDRKVLKQIKKWLKCGILEYGVTHKSDLGTPQGGVISPLLANIYLHQFDKYWTEQCMVDGKLVRYADDFVILFKTKKEAEAGLKLVKAKLTELDLELNEVKTKIVDTTEGKEGFDFLGFHYRLRWFAKYKCYLAKKWPSNKSMNSIRTKIRGIMGQRAILIRDMEYVVRRLNPILRGWMNYFRVGNSAGKFSQIDAYVHERFALWWSKKHGKSGRRWKSDFTWTDYKNSGVQRLTGNAYYW